MKKLLLVVCVVFLAGCSNSTFLPTLSQTTIDWIDAVMLNGSSYTGQSDSSQANREWEIGNVIGEVSFTMNEKVGAHYQMKDGDATYLPIGTKIYELVGYDPSFRIVADGRMFEVDEAGEADTLGDFLDIAGRVEAVRFISYSDSVMEEYSGANAEEFITKLLDLPYQPYSSIHEEAKGNPVFIEIELADGTMTQSAYFMEGRVLHYGAIVSDELANLIEKAFNPSVR